MRSSLLRASGYIALVRTSWWDDCSNSPRKRLGVFLCSHLTDCGESQIHHAISKAHFHLNWISTARFLPAIPPIGSSHRRARVAIGGVVRPAALAVVGAFEPGCAVARLGALHKFRLRP